MNHLAEQLTLRASLLFGGLEADGLEVPGHRNDTLTERRKLLEKARGHVKVRIATALAFIESLTEDGLAVSRDFQPLEAISAAAEASSAKSDNWVVIVVGLAASTQSWVEKGALSGVGHIRCADSDSRITDLKGCRNSRSGDDGDGQEAGERFRAEHDGGG